MEVCRLFVIAVNTGEKYSVLRHLYKKSYTHFIEFIERVNRKTGVMNELLLCGAVTTQRGVTGSRGKRP